MLHSKFQKFVVFCDLHLCCYPLQDMPITIDSDEEEDEQQQSQSADGADGAAMLLSSGDEGGSTRVRRSERISLLDPGPSTAAKFAVSTAHQDLCLRHSCDASIAVMMLSVCMQSVISILLAA